MKKLYFALVIVSLSILAGCSKDILKSYEDRIVGTWRLADVDKRGIGGNLDRLIFKSGQFEFSDAGDLVYTQDNGEVYKGSWDIDKHWIRGDCYGTNNCDDRRVRSLSMIAINFTTQDVKAEDFDEIEFVGTNRFNGYIYSGAHTYIFRFRR
jgi:hypothetical protein